MIGMKSRAALVALTASGLLIGGGLVTSVAAHADSDTTTVVAACSPSAIKKVGTRSQEGFPFPQQRWTVTFSNNPCKFNVRALAVCVDNIDNDKHNEPGGVVYGNGKSYHTCDAIQHLDTGYAQFYNGAKWVRL